MSVVNRGSIARKLLLRDKTKKVLYHPLVEVGLVCPFIVQYSLSFYCTNREGFFPSEAIQWVQIIQGVHPLSSDF